MDIVIFCKEKVPILDKNVFFLLNNTTKQNLFHYIFQILLRQQIVINSHIIESIALLNRYWTLRGTWIQ